MGAGAAHVAAGANPTARQVEDAPDSCKGVRNAHVTQTIPDWATADSLTDAALVSTMASWSSQRLPWAHAFHPKPRVEHELGLHDSGLHWDSSSEPDQQHADRRNEFWVSYLKRRRRMHTAAHELYIWLANVIMLPALLFSALGSVLSVMLKEEPLGPYIVAAISATSTFLIGVQQHIKVEAKAESHRISAHRFDQLVTEAVSRSIITGITVRDVAVWEKELHRIAEVNQFVMPSSIRRR